MINPYELVENLVAMLRDIPELVDAMNGDPEAIYAYHDQFPQNVSILRAIHQMPTPSIMAAWVGTSAGSFGGVDVWKHAITVYLRAPEAVVGDLPTAYYNLFRLLTKGVPTAAGVPLLNATVHPSCYPMDLPLIQRQSDTEGVDYFEVPISFTEIGDD